MSSWMTRRNSTFSTTWKRSLLRVFVFSHLLADRTMSKKNAEQVVKDHLLGNKSNRTLSSAVSSVYTIHHDKSPQKQSSDATEQVSKYTC